VELRSSLESARETLANHWTTVETADARSRANAHAQRDFSTAEKVLNTILYEVNAYSIAPTAIFDVARVWPTSIGTHYAVGGGARLSIVNANFTLGYAANPNRAKGEGPGALFFSIDVTDLFH
jgi:hypothetical protein